ncbi:MAG: lysophospholipid acyltransferase family protein [Proteobacteria bacterium]|nr:lysophospholipid acyltransferase family protein [Pseudomonadota bacterium]
MKKKIKYILEYIPFYLAVKTMQAMPFALAVKAGRTLGALLYRLSGKRVTMAENNIARALDLDKAEAAGIIKKAFTNVGITLAEFVNLPQLDRSFFEERVAIEGEENLIDAQADGKGVLLLGAHIGNWEVLGACLQYKFGNVSVIYRKTKNIYVDNFINSIRTYPGTETIPHRNSIRKVMSNLKKKGMVGILLDQHAIPEDAVVVDFFNRPAATNYGLAIIALKTGAPVVPVFVIRDGLGSYKCIYEKPIRPAKSDDRDKNIRDATSAFNTALEKIIRAYPEQWFWVHNRWKVD